RKLGRGRRALMALATAALGLGSLAALAVPVTPAGAAPPTGPTNEAGLASNGATLTASPVDNLTDGQGVAWTVNAANGSNLANVEVKICKTAGPPPGQGGPANYDSDTFSYTGSGGVNCVFDGPPPNGRQLGSALGTGDYDQIVSGGPGVTTLSGTFHAAIG